MRYRTLIAHLDTPDAQGGETRVREVERRVPLLGQVPLLGALFRSRSTDLEKTNLIVFIRPTILRDGAQAGIQTKSKYRHLLDLQLERGRRCVRRTRPVCLKHAGPCTRRG